MPTTLFDATIPTYLQILGAMEGLLVKAGAFCVERGIAEEQLIQARLAPDMMPFAYQVKSTISHSVGSIEGVRRGVYSPDLTPAPASLADLQRALVVAVTTLASMSPAHINELEGREMRFEMGATKLPFTAEGFLLSFSLPNFYFHAATAYDILRAEGAPLGKRDFLGAVRVAPASQSSLQSS